MAVHYSVTAQALAKPNISALWLTSTHSPWPCWCAEEIRKWKQIRKMPQDCIHPWKIKWRGTVPPQSHVKHIDFAHLSPRLRCNLKDSALHNSDGSAWCVQPEALPRCVICLLEKMLAHKWSYMLSERQQACHILKICAVLETQKDTSGGFHATLQHCPQQNRMGYFLSTSAKQWTAPDLMCNRWSWYTDKCHFVGCWEWPSVVVMLFLQGLSVLCLGSLFLVLWKYPQQSRKVLHN